MHNENKHHEYSGYVTNLTDLDKLYDGVKDQKVIKF